MRERAAAACFPRRYRYDLASLACADEIGLNMPDPGAEKRGRLPPGQVLTAKWPVLTYGATPRM